MRIFPSKKHLCIGCRKLYRTTFGRDWHYVFMHWFVPNENAIVSWVFLGACFGFIVYGFTL